MEERIVSDDDWLIRRVPPISARKAEQDAHRDNRRVQPSPSMMETQKDPETGEPENGLSCSLCSVMSPSALIAAAGFEISQGWRALLFCAGDVRRLTDREGQPLGLVVRHSPEEHDPGHCVIEGPGH